MHVVNTAISTNQSVTSTPIMLNNIMTASLTFHTVWDSGAQTQHDERE